MIETHHLEEMLNKAGRSWEKHKMRDGTGNRLEEI